MSLKSASPTSLSDLLEDDSKAALWIMARRFWPYLRPVTGRFLWGLGLGIIAAASNGVMIIGLDLIFSLVLDGKSATLGKDIDLPLVGIINLAEIFHLDEDRQIGLMGVVLACSGIPVMMFASRFLNYLSNYCIFWVGRKVLYQVRSDLFARVMSQSLGFFNQSKAGHLIQTVFNQSAVAQVNAVTSIQILANRPLSIIFTLVVLLSKDPTFTLLSLVVFPLCVAPVLIIGRRVRKAGAREQAETGAMLVNMQEAFSGIRLVKAYSREEYETKRFNRSSGEMMKNMLKWNRAMELVSPIVESVASIGLGAGLVYAWYTDLPLEDFLVLVMALTQLYPPAKELSKVHLNLQKASLATRTVLAVLDREPDIKDAPDAVELSSVEGAIRIQNVSFHYKESDGTPLERAALENVTLNLEPGKFYALVGPSGSGKSTLFSLLLRFYDVDRGEICVDGHDIRQISQNSLRNHIGIVSQDTFLFHDSIRENIRYGRLDATDEEIIEAAKRAHAHEFICEIQGGYDAVVGDSGANLSGGQKQRLSIARSILKNAPILLLDEATSALDTESEKIIQEAIKTLSAGKTVIAIAHRLSTVLEADQILVMREGEVAARGTHQELLKSSDLYQKLYQLQFQDSDQ